MKKLYHGACYYPELWDEDTLQEDIRIMKETGINLVRIGEFWWSKIEPNPREYNLEYITNLLDLLAKNDIDVAMCTPTPTPPIWITDGHPERLHVDAKGQTMIHGSRQHICTNNESIRAESQKIIQVIAKAVGNHPAVVLWQLDNEFKCHVRECYCQQCKHLWHKWLEQKYQTIENLNQSWGTGVWSQRYQRFDQVPQPFETTPFLHNSSIITQYKCFHREKIAEFATEQATIIRKYSQAPITTNGGMGFGIDNELLFKDLDVVGFDTYAPQSMFYAFTMNCDIWRGIKKNRNFWLLETSASHTGALDRHANAHPNGYLVSEAVSLYALGGAAFTYWLWRQQAYGCEISHSAVISSWGKPGVGYQNVLAVEEARKEIEPFILKTQFSQGELAISYSDRARVFMETENHKKNDYRGLMTHFYQAILKTGIHRDLIPENMELSGYKMLMTPLMYHLSDAYLERAKAFVEAGGIWIVGPVTGGRTEEHTITKDGALGKKLEALAGVEALYTYPIENTGATGKAFGIEAPLKLWSTVFKLEGAEAVGFTSGGVTPDMPFITEHKVGKGKVVMVGSMPSEAAGDRLWKVLVEHYASEAGIKRKANVSEGTIVAFRHDEKSSYLVAVNMDGQGGSLDLEVGCLDVLTGEKVEAGLLTIVPYGYRILQLQS